MRAKAKANEVVWIDETELGKLNQAVTDLEEHKGDMTAHITEEERGKWDKAVTDLEAHKGDTEAHLSEEQRGDLAKWKEMEELILATVPQMELVVDMTETQVLDLSSALCETTYKGVAFGSEYTPRARIDWGDGQTTGVIGMSDAALLKHTYSAGGSYTVKITGIVRWFMANTTNQPADTTTKKEELSAHLTEIKIPNKCPIVQFAGAVKNAETSAITRGFAFQYCSKLTRVTGNLFNNYVDAVGNTSCFNYSFRYCTALQYIPSLTFPDTLLVPSFVDMFRHCTALTTVLNLNLGWEIPNTSATNLAGFFRECSGITSALPTWWTTHTAVYAKNNCFTGCTKASNYLAVPSAWGGPAEFQFIIDQSKSDPAQMVTYAGENIYAKPMKMDFSKGAIDYGSWNGSWLLNRFKPCVLNADGSVRYYLNKSNLNLRADNNANIANDLKNTGSTWNAMVEVGQVWIKEVEESGKFHIYLRESKADGYDCWTHYNNKNALLGTIFAPMYKGSKDSNGKMRSLSGQAPNVNEAGDKQRGYCQANGTGWDVCDWSFHRLMGYVVTLLGRSTDSQTVFGNGIEAGATNKPTAAVKTGGSEDKGWFYGVNNDWSAHVRVLGMEDLWGNMWDICPGIMTNTGAFCVKMTPGTADGTKGTSYDYVKDNYYNLGNLGFSSESGDGQIDAMKLVPGKGIFPTKTETTMNTHFCDHLWWNVATSATCIARVGSSWTDASGNAGVFALTLATALGHSNSNFGASPAFKKQ